MTNATQEFPIDAVVVAYKHPDQHRWFVDLRVRPFGMTLGKLNAHDAFKDAMGIVADEFDYTESDAALDRLYGPLLAKLREDIEAVQGVRPAYAYGTAKWSSHHPGFHPVTFSAHVRNWDGETPEDQISATIVQACQDAARELGVEYGPNPRFGVNPETTYVALEAA